MFEVAVVVVGDFFCSNAALIWLAPYVSAKKNVEKNLEFTYAGIKVLHMI